jgi:hypothetical protein
VALVKIVATLAPMLLAPPVGVESTTVFAVSVPAVQVIEPPLADALFVLIVIVPVAVVPALMLAPITAPPEPPALFTSITTALAEVLVVVIVPEAFWLKPEDETPA